MRRDREHLRVQCALHLLGLHRSEQELVSDLLSALVDWNHLVALVSLLQYARDTQKFLTVFAKRFYLLLGVLLALRYVAFSSTGTRSRRPCTSLVDQIT